MGFELEQRLQHAAGLETITQVQLRTPHAGSAWQSLGHLERECAWLTVVTAENHGLEVEFDNQRAGQTADFRPTLPVVLRW